ncbi:hypothetical protein HPB50_012674 [Hyalomma asiaticum]|uniref:Uncharacterized protein n=1 Tax=Hyalomma asiaticum TaxID=266040 RepID=A0ACB7RX18_HYAAI|nr:hypothetical protein HPB50_012674 [Hyalomma asiaticum]
MDRRRRSRGVLRPATTRLICPATEPLQAQHPPLTDMEVIVDDLQDNDSTLAALGKKVADLMSDGDGYEKETTVALEYHD